MCLFLVKYTIHHIIFICQRILGRSGATLGLIQGPSPPRNRPQRRSEANFSPARVRPYPYAWNDCPQPQEPFEFGFLIANPAPVNPS